MVNEIKLFYDLTAEKTADEWYKEEILKPHDNGFCFFASRQSSRT